MNSSAFLKIIPSAKREVIIFKKASELMHYPIFNEVEYVGKRQIVKIEQLATKQDNNNLKHIFIVAYILGREVLENSSGRTV